MAYSSSSRLCRWVGGGIITFLAVAGPLRSDTYIEWKARVFTEAEQTDPSVSGETALSPAGDGIPNLLKYAFGIDPHEDGSLALPRMDVVQALDPVTGLPAKYPTITYQVSSVNAPGDLHFVPELSFDLQSWTRGITVFASPTSQQGVSPGDPSHVTFQALAPSGGGTAIFLRLRVIEGESLPNDWQITNFGHAGIDPAADPDGDGQTNLDEFLHGTDPNDYYNGRRVEIVVISGNNQAGLARTFLPAPLVVRVRDLQGNPLANAPVRFSVSSGSGSLSQFNGGTSFQTVEVRSDSDGMARASYLEPDAFGVSSSINASAISSSITAEVTFNTTTGEGLIIEPQSIDAIVNAGQSNTIPIMIANETPERISFSTLVENGSLPNLAYTDSDQPQGPAFVWNDIRETGTLLAAVSDADDDYESFDIGFAFPYFGNSYTTIYVSSNGFITLGEGSAQYQNFSLPDTSMPSNEIAPFHTDLNLGDSGDVYYQEYSDRVVIQFTDAARYIGDGHETFQVVLQRDGTILFYYLDMNGAVEEATVGIQNATGDIGLTVAYQAPYLRNNLAVRITSASDWLTVSPSMGNLDSGESISLQVLLNQAGLTAGTYNGAVHVTAGPGLSSSSVPRAFAQTTVRSDLSVTININEAPQVTLLEPTADVTARLGDSIQLRASAQDPNGISRIEFYDGPDKIAEAATSPYVFSWNAAGGHHVITARAIDSLGAIGVSRHVAVNKDTDTDNDGLGDEWEMFFFGNLDQQGDGDSDRDGATNLQEYRAASLPNNGDTDGDGLSDGDEINAYHTNATAKDTDGDGMDDGWEVQHHLNPSANDADDDDDHDGLTNKQEFAYGTDPTNPDTDGDHIPDGIDGWPLNDAVAPPRLPIFRYAILDITPTRIWSVNNSPDGVATYPLDRRGIDFPPGYLETADDHLILPIASNDLGQTVGSIAYTHLANGGTIFGPPHACILPETDGGLATVLFLWGDSNQSFAPGSIAVDMNNAGQILIQSNSSPSGDSIHHAAIWQNGAVTDVAVGDPLRINQQGTVLMSGFVTKGGQTLVIPFLPDDFTDSYADDTEIVIGSGSHGSEIWHDGKSAALAVPEGTAHAYRINNRVQIFGEIITRPGFGGNAGIWQNGQFFYIRDLIPQDSGGEWDRLNHSGIVKELRINDQGMIILRANHVLQDGSGRTVSSTPFLLMPVELMVDANRDGQMSFTDAAIHDADRTDQSRPYRFWLNDDDDTELGPNETGAIATEEEKVPASRPDYSLHQIVSKRNLEDFSRLWIFLGGLEESIKSGEVRVGLRWRNVTPGTNPAVNIYPSADGEGSDSYLKDDAAAQGQLNGVYNEAVRDLGGAQTIGAGTLFVFKSDYWNGLSSENPRKCLLFEAAGEGMGELEIVFFNRNLAEIGRGGDLWLDLKNVKRMYERAKAQPENILAPNGDPTGSLVGPMSYVDDPINAGLEFDRDPDETEKALVFVHGWSINYSDYINFAETMFKRLWHQGFKSRFCTLRWDPLVVSQISDISVSNGEYNRSEHRAWLYGESLRQFAESLKTAGFAVSLLGHSMGNVVCGSSLEKGLAVENYILMEAAVPAGCYDSSGDSIVGGVNGYPRFWNAELAEPTPDYDLTLFGERTQGYRGFLSSISTRVSNQIVNFHNSDDYALATGFKAFGLIEANWEANEEKYKPDGRALTDWHYHYYPSRPDLTKRATQEFTFSVGRFVTESYEMKAFVARPRSRAVGAGEGTAGNPVAAGPVTTHVNMRTEYGFDTRPSDHSGQFNRTIQQVAGLYERILETLK